MENFGYKATEGLSESIKNGAKTVLEQVKIFIQNDARLGIPRDGGVRDCVMSVG